MADAPTTGLVLVADDEAWHRMMIEKRLRLEGFTTVGAPSGKRALELMHERQPDAVLLDMMMPGMTGLDVLRLKSQEADILAIPVIVVSGRGDPSSRLEGLSLGAVDYLNKEPLQEEEMLAKVKNHVRAHQHHRQIVRQALELEEHRRELQRQNKEIARLASIDPLTGLGNRRLFDQRWQAEIRLSERHGQPLSVAVIDIDHFKSVNDTFGHKKGDDILVEVAKLIQAGLREEDTAARVGGEEFQIIFTQQGSEGARNACERLRQMVEEKVELPDGRHCTISIGLAGSDRVTELEHLVEQADQALYRAKQGGRNQVRISGEESDGR